MFPRSLRLPSRSHKGERWIAKNVTPFFAIRSRPNQLGHPRFAVLVGTKVDRRASRRHLLKRWAAAHLHKRQKENRDIILSVLPPANSLPRKKFYEELEKAARER